MSRPALEHERPPDYLGRLAASDLGRAYKALVVDRMTIEPGSTVLDLGCGPGADLAAFAAAVGAGGRVVGVDLDNTAVAEASAVVVAQPEVAVVVADVQRLPVVDASVDRVHADRVVQHVEQPSVVVREAARVLRPGGVVAFAEPDWDTLVVDHPDAAVPVAYRRFITDRVVRNARVGRQLPRLCEEQGLAVTDVVPVTAVHRDVHEADRVLGFRRVTARAVEAGYLSPAVAEEWLHHLVTEPFLASLTLFVTVATKPGR